MALQDIHRLLGTAFLYYTVIITIWSLVHLFRQQEIGGSFWGAVAIGEGLMALQVLVGVIMVLQGLQPARSLHFVYGGVALLTWPAVFAFTRSTPGRREALWWALTSAFLFGITLRAMATAS
jgi:heme A synthase